MEHESIQGCFSPTVYTWILVWCFFVEDPTKCCVLAWAEAEPGIPFEGGTIRMGRWQQTQGVDRETDLLLSPLNRGVWINHRAQLHVSTSCSSPLKMINCTSRSHSFALGSQSAPSRWRRGVCSSDLFHPLPLLGMNKRVINCVGGAAAQRQDGLRQQAQYIRLCYNTPLYYFDKYEHVHLTNAAFILKRLRLSSY